MHLKSFTIIFAALLCSLGVYAQPSTGLNDRITVSFSKVTLSAGIATIERVSKYRFFYDSQKTNLTQVVSLTADDMPIAAAISQMLSTTDLNFEITNNQIALFRKTAANERKSNTITGVVMDSKSVPLGGVTIVVGTTNTATITDDKGRFTLSVKEFPLELNFSFIGFQSQRLSLTSSRSNVSVYMIDDIIKVDDIVVVGYGSQKKINLTGAVATVDEKQLKNRQGYSVTHMLQGTVPGVNVTTASGMPGNEATVNIRGYASINGGKPLVLIDGVEGELAKVNPNDIASISVLKDASSAAIYGARASFGVVLVTTKGGITTNSADLKTKVAYSGRWGFGRPTTSTDYETRGYYSVWLNDTFMKAYSGTPYTKYTEADYDELWARRNDRTEHPDRPWVVIDQRTGKDTYVYYANTDWYHYLYKDTRPTVNQDISLSGGNNKVQYFLSGGYYSEEGVVKRNTDNFQQINFRSKIGFAINKWLNISNNTSYYNKKYNYPGPSPLSDAFKLDKVHAMASFVPVNPDGTNVYQTALMDYTIMDGLPAIHNKGLHKNTDFNDYMNTTTELTYKPMKGLTFTGNFTYSFNSSRFSNRNVNVDYSIYPGEVQTLNTGRFEDKLAEGVLSHNFYSANAFATYEATFSQDHNFKATVGYNWETKMLKDIRAYGNNLLSESLADLDLVGQNSKGERVTNVSGGRNEYAIMGIFGRINYDYKGRYLLEVSGRYDGTSRFKRGQRWGLFPSFSAGWRICDEKFFAPLRKTIDNLKLRVSFGSLGNQQVGYYDYIQTISIGTQNYLFGGTKPAVANISAPPASNLTWERTEHTNIGLDLGMLSNRLTFSGDFYIRDTKDMLAQGATLPATYGASLPKTNSADLRTKGYELSLGWRDTFRVLSKPFTYSINLMFSDYFTEITKFDNPDKSLSQPHYVGKRIGEIWGYRTDGYFISDEEARNWGVDQSSINAIINSSAGAENGLRAGDIKFRDLDGNDIISKGQNRVGASGDYQIIGNSQPRYNYGINAAVAWNGIDISVFFQGVGKRDWYPGADNLAFWGPYARPYATYIPRNFHTDIWSEESPNAYFPRPRGYVALSGTDRELTAVNDKYLQNIGYCRLKNLTVGYTLPYKWTSKLMIEHVRLYFSGENLVTWSKLRSDYIDPEQAMADNTARTYPYQKMFIFGIDVNF